MILIGLSGKKHSGKDEVARIISKHFETCERIAFADALKDEVCKSYSVTRQYLEEHKDNFRLILQGHGTDYRRRLFGEDYWLKQWMKRSLKSEAQVIVVPDVRFKNEAELIHQCNGFLWRIRRDTNDRDGHLSECELDGYHGFDHYIDNTKSLQQLEVNVILALEMFGLIKPT